jgi:hypothetical protein
MKVIGTIVVAVVVFLALVYGLFFLNKDLSGRQQDVERSNFEHSQSLIKGTTADIERDRLELETKKDRVERIALRRHILETASKVDMTLLPPDTQEYVRRLRDQAEPVEPLGSTTLP